MHMSYSARVHTYPMDGRLGRAYIYMYPIDSKECITFLKRETLKGME